MSKLDWQAMIDFMEKRYCDDCLWINEYTHKPECNFCIIFHRLKLFKRRVKENAEKISNES